MPSSRPDTIESNRAKENHNARNLQEDNEGNRLHVCTEATDWARRGEAVCLHTEEATEADCRRDAIERLIVSRTGEKPENLWGRKDEDQHEKRTRDARRNRMKQVSFAPVFCHRPISQLDRKGFSATHTLPHTNSKCKVPLCLVSGLRSTHTSVHHGRQRPSLR